MDRRDALKALATIPGLTVTPLTKKDADDAALIIVKVPQYMSAEAKESFRAAWIALVEGTPLDGVKVAILEQGMDIEVIRKKA